jgi:hypothetical protein
MRVAIWTSTGRTATTDITSVGKTLCRHSTFSDDGRVEYVSGEVDMRHPVWTPVIFDLLIAAIGVVSLVIPSIPLLGKLPGDIRLERENYRFYLPVTTCLVLSLLLSGILWLVRFFRSDLNQGNSR